MRFAWFVDIDGCGEQRPLGRVWGKHGSTADLATVAPSRQRLTRPQNVIASPRPGFRHSHNPQKSLDLEQSIRTGKLVVSGHMLRIRTYLYNSFELQSL